MLLVYDLLVVMLLEAIFKNEILHLPGGGKEGVYDMRVPVSAYAFYARNHLYWGWRNGIGVWRYLGLLYYRGDVITGEPF